MNPAVAFALPRVKSAWRPFAEAVFSRVLFRLIPMQAPVLTGLLLDAVTRPGGQSARVWSIAAALGGLAVAAGLTGMWSVAAGARFTKRFVSGIRSETVRKWLFAPHAFERQFGSSDLLSRTLVDVPGLRRWSNDVCVESLTLLFRIAYPAVMLFRLDAVMALVALAIIPAQSLLTFVAQRRQRSFAKPAKENRLAITKQIKENLDARETVQSLDAATVLFERMQAESNAAEALELKAKRYSAALTGAVWMLTTGGAAATWTIGAMRILEGRMSAGDLLAFTGFVAFLYTPFRRVARIAESHRQGLAILERLRELVDAPVPALGGSGLLQPSNGLLRCERVSLSYGGRSILSGVTEVFRRGELTLLCGASGCGKSSLLRLLAGLEAPTSGRILLDGQDLAGVSPESVRRHAVLVPQKPIIFSGTFADNLRLAKPGATLEEMVQAASSAGALSFIAAHETAFETPLGERGVQLSGGQAYRLSLARALLRNPQVLLLDEPVAALDPDSERSLIATLNQLKQQVTIVMVGHRLSSPEGVDRVIVLDRGCPVPGLDSLSPQPQS